MKNVKISLPALLMFLLMVLPAAIFGAPGDLDPSFGTGGVARTGFGNYTDAARAAAIQPDGKIVVVGITQQQIGEPVSRAAIARYNPNGTLDASFANGGKTFHGFGIISSYNSVVIQPDGKILAAGRVSFNGRNDDFLIIRYNSDGSLDNSFGNAGVVTTDFGTEISDSIATVQIQPDGKILAIGDSGANGNNSYAVARYTANGALDISFGTGGRTVSAASLALVTAAGILQSDGKIIAVGRSRNGTYYGFVITRFNSDGALDQTFGTNGRFTANFGNGNSLATDAALAPDGKIVVTGYTENSASQQDFAVVRINSNGTLDQTFGASGIVTTDVDNVVNQANAVTIQRNGKIIIGGTSFTAPRTQAVLIRYNQNGTLDNTFGNNGTAKLTDGYFYSGLAVELQPDGKIIFAGYSTATFFVARFLGDVPQKTIFDFDGDGKTDVAVFRDGIWHLQRSQTGFAAVYWGIPTDKIAPADYDGDGKTDVAVFRPSNGEWSVLRSSDNTALIRQFGAAEDLPRPADYDGDGKADINVFRPSNGTWHRVNSSNNQIVGIQFGTAGDAPLVADFDGDGKSDTAVYRPSNGTWYWLRSSDNHFVAVQFGEAADKPIPADFDGDGKSDIVVFRPSNGYWYYSRSSDNHFVAAQFGTSGDAPAAGDYDGDGRFDLGVFRPTNGIWYLNRSQSGFTGVQFGVHGDKPAPNAFVP